MRRIALWLALAASLIAPTAAYAQAPPAVPALPDSERRSSFGLSASVCTCSIGFQLYGTGTDYGNWIDVYLTTGSGATAVTTKLTAVTDYTIASATGPLATIPRPITNAVLTLTAARTGTLQILGAERPRRLSQFPENAGVSARSLNVAITDLVMQNRETWDKLNSVTGRALLTNPGETIGLLPNQTARSGGVLGFDSSGNPIALATLTGLGNVIGPNTSVVGHIATFGNTSGTLLLDGGLVGAGDVVGPASATDSAIVLFNGTGGKIIKNGPAGTTTTVLHGNAAGAPTYSQVSLTADVVGVLPLAFGGSNAGLTASNGGIVWSSAAQMQILAGTATANLPLLSGSTATPSWATITYPTAGTSGGILGFTSATTLASSVALTGNQLVIGQGAGSLPIPLGSPGTTTTVLHGNAAGPPSFAAISLTADITGTLAVGNGGTGLTAGTSGGVPYFSGAATIASSSLLTTNALMLGGGAGAAPATPVGLGTSTTVLHGNAGGAPSFGAVVLTTDVSGILPVASGGTGLASGTSGGILGYTAAGTLASSAILTTSQLVIGGGAGATPAPLGTLGTSTTLLHGNAGGAPTFSAVALASDVSGTLPLANGGTGQGSAALARTASGLNIDSVTTFGNTNLSAAITDRTIATSATFTAQRTVTLPSVASFNAGQQLVIVDAFGAINGANTMVIAAAGGDTINGTSSITITAQYGGAVLWPVGSNKWGYIASSAGGGSGTVTSVQCGNITISVSGTCITDPSLYLQNCSLAASVNTNLLTVALKDAAGSDPTATSPCTIGFRSDTATTGTVTTRYVTAATSINTNATGATLGSATSTAFRFWVVAFDNAGTVVLGLYNASTFSLAASGSCKAINETVVQSSTAISGSATSAQVYYTPNGTTISSKAVRIVGYVEYNSTGLATPGTYGSAPNFVQVFGPGVKRPCEPVQELTFFTGTATASTSASFVVTNLSQAIVPYSAANLINVQATGPFEGATQGVAYTAGIFRGSTPQIGSNGIIFTSTGGDQIVISTMFGIDKPNTTSSTTYAVYIQSNGTNTCTWSTGSRLSVIKVQEIMG